MIQNLYYCRNERPTNAWVSPYCGRATVETCGNWAPASGLEGWKERRNLPLKINRLGHPSQFEESYAVSTRYQVLPPTAPVPAPDDVLECRYRRLSIRCRMSASSIARCVAIVTSELGHRRGGICCAARVAAAALCSQARNRRCSRPGKRRQGSPEHSSCTRLGLPVSSIPSSCCGPTVNSKSRPCRAYQISAACGRL